MIRDCQCPRARHQHGTEQAYITDACRCDNCRAAHAARMAWRRRQYAYGRDIAHLVPATGAARRVEALAWVGWSFQAVATRLGWDPVTIQRVRLQPRIAAAKHAAIAAIYDELWDQEPPTDTKSQRISASRARATARRRGWLPPASWDDDYIDDPTAGPGTPNIEPLGDHAERNEVIRDYAALGLSDQQIADRIGMTRSAVSKHRERHGITAGCARGVKAGPSWRSMRAESRKGAAA